MMKSEIIQLKINMRSNIDIAEECFPIWDYHIL